MPVRVFGQRCSIGKQWLAAPEHGASLLGPAMRARSIPQHLMACQPSQGSHHRGASILKPFAQGEQHRALQRWLSRAGPSHIAWSRCCSHIRDTAAGGTGGIARSALVRCPRQELPWGLPRMQLTRTVPLPPLPGGFTNGIGNFCAILRRSFQKQFVLQMG